MLPQILQNSPRLKTRRTTKINSLLAEEGLGLQGETLGIAVMTAGTEETAKDDTNTISTDIITAADTIRRTKREDQGHTPLRKRDTTGKEEMTEREEKDLLVSSLIEAHHLVPIKEIVKSEFINN